MSCEPRHGLSRRSLILGCAALAGGCGLRPALAPGGPQAALYGQIAFAAPDTVAGFEIRQQLRARLGATDSATYMLDVDPRITRDSVALTSDDDTTRFNLVGAAAWVLRAPDGAARLSGTARSFTGYSATGSTVATQVAAEDAERRLAIALADLIVADLTLRAGALS